VEAGRADLDRVLERAPEDVQARIDRAGARIGLGDHTGAIADLDLALEARPGSALVLLNRGFARSLRGDPAGAIADYEAGLKTATPGSFEATKLRARLDEERAKLR